MPSVSFFVKVNPLTVSNPQLVTGGMRDAKIMRFWRKGEVSLCILSANGYKVYPTIGRGSAAGLRQGS
jgi:hypothetical protein